MPIKLNIRFLIVLGVTLVAVGVAGFFLYGHQKNHRLADYLTQATRAEEQGKLDRAGRLLRAYVLAAPHDLDARMRYAGFVEKTANTLKGRSDAMSVYEQILKADPARVEARRRAVELAVELGRADAGEKHAAALLEVMPTDARALYLKGVCHEAKKQYEEAVEAYARSGRADPKPEAFVRRASVLKIHLKQEDATADGKETGPQAVLNELVTARPTSFEGYLARAVYRRTYDHKNGLARAREDLDTARKFAPDDPGVLLASAQVAVDQASAAGTRGGTAKERAELLAEARRHLRRGLEVTKENALLHVALADVESRGGNHDEAVRVLEAARKEVKRDGLPTVLFALAELHADAGDQVGTDDVLGRLTKLKQDPRRIDLLRGTSLVRQGRWYEGSGVLEKVRAVVGNDTDQAVRVDLLLARCYGQLGDVDRQLVTYLRAVKADTLDARPRIGYAGALATLGRVDEAADEYRHVTQMERSPPTVWLALARLMVYRNLVRPPAERQWAEVDRLLAAAVKAVPEAVEVPLLEAEVLVAKGKADDAKKLLTARRDGTPTEPEYWFALAVLTDRGGDNAEANALLDEAKGKLGDTADLRIARLRVTAYKSAEQAAGVLDGLADGADKYPRDDRARLYRSVAGAYWLIDRPADAANLWAKVAELRPNELSVRLLQFDAALKQNDDGGMTTILADIRRIEGGGPLEKYGSAARLVWQARRGDKGGLGEARVLLTSAAARRPRWSRVPLLQAEIDELQGNIDLTVDKLKLAVELGDRQVPVIKRLAQLLDERGRGREADDLLTKLDAQAPISNDLQRLAAEVSLRLDVDRSITLAKKAVAKDSKDYKERVWLARILSAGGKAKEAEVEFEEAVKIAGDMPEVWVAFVQHAARTGGKDKAAAKAVAARAVKALPTKERLAVAVCHEIAGDKDEAERRYLAAIKTDPADVRSVRATAAFYQQAGQPSKAEPFLRQLMSAELKAPGEEVLWARRNLALALGLRPDNPGYEEAIRLLDANAAAGEQVDDLRTRALVTATRPGHRQEVIALLEKAEKLRPPQPEHEFLLAKLYEAEGQWAKARSRMLRLIGGQKDNVGYLRAFARSLLRRGDLSDAEVWLTRLTEVAPDAFDTTTLRVQLLCRTGKAADALAVLKKFREAKSDPPADPAGRALALADLYDTALAAGAGEDAATAAVELYAEYKAASKRVDAALPLAGFYARTGRPADALAQCESAEKAGCPLDRVIVVALAATGGGTATATQFKQVEGWLTAAMAKTPKSPDLRFLLATLREQQERYDDAEGEYAAVLAQSPAHAGALNNLAFLLAMRGKGAEAVKATEGAVKAVNDIPPELLDTRGVAHTAAGDLTAARKDLEASAVAGGGATTHFHLAVVWDKLKDKPKATAALRLARSAGLRVGQLHPLERPVYDELMRRVNP